MRSTGQALHDPASSEGAFSLPDRFLQSHRIPVDDDGGEQVEAGHAVVLAFACAVADFALAAVPEGILGGVVRFAFLRVPPGNRLMALQGNRSRRNLRLASIGEGRYAASKRSTAISPARERACQRS